MKNQNKYTGNRLKDWIIDCDICGTPCWFSETRKLGIYTGQGGARVCKRHQDPIDYGLVPYKIPAERSVPETRILQNFNNNTNITGVPALVDYELHDPLNTNPADLYPLVWDTSNEIWDQSLRTWDGD